MATQDDVRSDLLELAERCEKASGPDREIDHSIGHALRWRDEHTILDPVPMFTFSIDAAMTLVPEGWRWVMRQASADECKGAVFARLETGDFKTITWGKGGDYITDVVSGQDVFVWAATPALAICAASLRARASSNG